MANLITISGRTYRVSDHAACQGTGVGYDPTNADKVGYNPHAGKCPGCTAGKIYSYMPDTHIAEAMAHEENLLRDSRAMQENGELPDWMC